MHFAYTDMFFLGGKKKWHRMLQTENDNWVEQIDVGLCPIPKIIYSCLEKI